MATVEDICNLALDRVGVTDSISDYTNDPSDTAKAMRRLFPTSVAYIESLFPWTCLKGVTVLSTNTATNAKFSYTHTVASTVLTIIDINGDDSELFERQGTELLINSDTGYFTHTTYDDTPADWDHMLVAAVVAYMAIKLSARVTKDPNFGLLLNQEYLAVLTSAVKLAAIEGDSAKFMDLIAAMSQYFPTEELSRKPSLTS